MNLPCAEALLAKIAEAYDLTLRMLESLPLGDNIDLRPLMLQRQELIDDIVGADILQDAALRSQLPSEIENEINRLHSSGEMLIERLEERKQSLVQRKRQNAVVHRTAKAYQAGTSEALSTRQLKW